MGFCPWCGVVSDEIAVCGDCLKDFSYAPDTTDIWLSDSEETPKKVKGKNK